MNRSSSFPNLKLLPSNTPTKSITYRSKCFSILGFLIITVLVFYIIVDCTKYSILTLKIDSSIIVQNYLWEKTNNNNSEAEINKLRNLTDSDSSTGINDAEMNKLTDVKDLVSNDSNNVSNVSNVLNKTEIAIPIFDRYISCTYKTCSGIGNQDTAKMFAHENDMFRFASLYGIGRHFNRTAFFPADNKCQQKTMPEIKETFPNFFNTIKLLKADPNDTRKSDFALDCCQYQNPNIMHDVPQKYLILNGNYLQSYKFFNDRKAEIRHFFDFGTKIKKSVEEMGKKIFGDDNSHKLCIHIRRGDFIKTEQLESQAEFIEPSIKFLHQNLTEKGISNISLIFLGTDFNFTANLKFNKDLFVSVYHPRPKSRGEDMYFGIRYCDTLLISASGSTFAWWIGYLLPDGTQIFYNTQISKKRKDYTKEIYDFDVFPPEWNMLELNRTQKTVKLDNQWYYERFSWPRKGIQPLIG